MRACWFSLAAWVLLGIAPPPAAAWGTRTHRLVTDLAVDLLPAACAPVLREHRALLLSRSVEPDTVLRQREGQREAVRHFIDLDAYMPYPFADFPRFYRQAVARAGRAAVHERGVLPWVILRFSRTLRDDLRRGDAAAIVRSAGYLSHYVADAHQPLHLTVNYDGQHSGNRGVHLRLEVGVVDDRLVRYEAALRGRLQPARPIADLRRELFDGFTRTYPLIDTILRADREAASALWPHNPLYFRRLDTALHAVIEQQLGSAATLLASLWVTACDQPASQR
ncbi:MAG: hypothetical protein HY699_02905 [Deltaproteobacteria bacterium]|nr:hypothetical protein [Deltaproteobacteria bacterium]